MALSKVGVKPHLTSQGVASTHPFGLAPFGVADTLTKRKNLPRPDGWHEQHAIVITKDDVLPGHRPIADRRGVQRILGTVIKALRTGRDGSKAEDRQPDCTYVRCIAMQPPDDQSLQASGLGL